jgi:hypothetical protein
LGLFSEIGFVSLLIPPFRQGGRMWKVGVYKNVKVLVEAGLSSHTV